MYPARSLYLMCLFPPTSCRRARRIFAFNDTAAAKNKPTVPPIQPKGTMIAPEYPKTYALFTALVRTKATWYQGSNEGEKKEKKKKKRVSHELHRSVYQKAWTFYYFSDPKHHYVQQDNSFIFMNDQQDNQLLEHLKLINLAQYLLWQSLLTLKIWPHIYIYIGKYFTSQRTFWVHHKSYSKTLIELLNFTVSIIRFKATCPKKNTSNIQKGKLFHVKIKSFQHFMNSNS